MIFAARVQVGEEPYDLTKGTGGSAVTVQSIREAADEEAKGRLVVGEPGGESDPIPVREAAGMFNSLQLGPTDHLSLWRVYEDDDEERDPGPVDVVLSWS